MTDVARLAGVSHQTVSRVVNNHSSVSPEVRDRVELAIRRLRYRRNPSARALASSRSLKVGVISFGLAQFGPSVILTGIVAEAERAGYTTSLVTLADPLRDLQPAVDHLLALPVDGIIVVAPIDTALVSAREIAAGVPLVVFEPGADHLAGNVVTDEVAGARAATEHLLSLGHRTVHHVSGPAGWLGTSARLRGWSNALAAAGRPRPEPLVGDWTTGSGFEAGLHLAADAEVTAVFVANDQMALGVIKALVTNGRHVPADVSVIGFDDLPEAPYFIPALTTMRIDFSEVGRLAVSRLLALITAATDRADRSVGPELIVRASTAAPPLQNTHNQGATP